MRCCFCIFYCAYTAYVCAYVRVRVDLRVYVYVCSFVNPSAAFVQNELHIGLYRIFL